MDDFSPSKYSYEANPTCDGKYFPRMPWTIEQQLHSYALSPQHTERHEILWVSWQQDRRWLSELLEYTVFSTPMYSRHNASHCESVIHNIECLLGEDEIRRLSATDCFALLIAVYLHDIGMVALSNERRNAMQDDAFRRFIEQLKQSPDTKIRNAAELFSNQNPPAAENGKGVPSQDNQERHYLHQYDVYCAVALLLAEYQRKQHADASAKRMEQWIKDPAKLKNSLVMTGIPIRIFLQIAACARMHGESSFDKLMKTLPKCDGGYAQDTYHPMFIGVLLALGDILDLDNDRFNPFAEEVLGDDLFPPTSKMHYRKHQSIRSLRISPKSIHIEADCHDSDELRQLCQEMDWLESFLKNCSYHWASIAPDNFCGCLPVVELVSVSLNGAPIPANLVTTKFELSQKKAFHLLSGAKLYECRFPFLRELLQNAIDAVKLQYWTDYSASEFWENEDDQAKPLELRKANSNLSLKKYPIHIDIAVKKRRKYSESEPLDVVKDDLEMPLNDLLREYEFGVEIKVQDCGIGISAEDIQQISKVGSSHEHRLEKISQFPEWLRPTGHFGIGLQSLFLVDNHFRCTTRTRTEECYQMTFHSGEKAEGYINVIPLSAWEKERGNIPYGSSFSVFISEHYKVSHEEDMTGWLSMDPYQEDYSKYRKLRRSIELMVQIEEYINDLIGEPLFPIFVREQELDASLSGMAALLDKVQQRLQVETHSRKTTWQRISANTKRLERKDADEQYCWLFCDQIQKLPCNLQNQLNDGSVYYFDSDHGRLYGWSQRAECFFCCSTRRILKPYEKSSREDEIPQKQNGVRLFIKGLFIKEIFCSENDLFEYIDIKNDSLQNYLQMNRDGLTAEGTQKLNSEIIPQIRKTFQLILEQINEQNLEIWKSNRQRCLDTIFDLCKKGPPSNLENTVGRVDMSTLARKLQKKLVNMPQTAFSYTSLQFDRDGDALGSTLGSILGSEEWEHFWKSASSQLSHNHYTWLKITFKKEIKGQIQMDLTSRLLETLLKKINEALEPVKGQKPSTLDKAKVDQFRRDLEKIHQLVLLCALCFYYANVDKSIHENSCAGSAMPCSWEYLNDGIARILTYEDSLIVPAQTFVPKFISLWKSVLFLPCVELNQLEKLEWKSIADVMVRDNHYAVFSSRSSQQGHWKHILVHLTPLSNAKIIPALPEDATVVELIHHRPSAPQDCLVRENLLNAWHEDVIEKIYHECIANAASSTSAANTVNTKIWENIVTRWTVKNLPSISIGSDPSGNNRINVLSFLVPHQLYLNDCMTNLLLGRMQDVYEKHNAQRMCTTTWDGLEPLCCKDDITSNILRVDRGKVSNANKKNVMLMAFANQLSTEQITLPNGMPLVEVQEVQIQTVYDLFLLLQNIYTKDADGEKFGFTFAEDVLNCCCEIVGFLNISMEGIRKFGQQAEYSSESADQVQDNSAGEEGLLEIVQTKFKERLQEKSIESQDASEDESNSKKRSASIFLDKNRSKLLLYLEELYIGLFQEINEGNALCPIKKINSWSQVDLPDERDRYINSLLIYLYGFNMESASQWDLPGFEIYSTTEAFQHATQKVFSAARYLFQFACQQYQEEFLRNICRWWADSVWTHDSGQNIFIKYSVDHLVSKLDKHELLELYIEQIRKIMRAQVINLKSPVKNVLDKLPSAFRRIRQFD